MLYLSLSFEVISFNIILNEADVDTGFHRPRATRETQADG